MDDFCLFKDLELPQALHAALDAMGFTALTPVQAASLPHALEGKDILGSAQTGTGKTAAFGIPLLAKIMQNPGSKALVLAPTRELAAQIHKVLGQMSQGSKLKGALVVGGESFWRQMSEIKDGADFLVCTPGRLIDHLQAGLKLQSMTMLVLDEVDRMLDMGFAPQLRDIAQHLPESRQTLFFSATLPREILSIAAQYLKQPVKVSVGSSLQPTDAVEQINIDTTEDAKKDLLLRDLKQFKGRVLVFARTKQRVDRITDILEQNGIGAVRLHGGLLQGQRKTALDRFRRGSHLVMVATDIAGRGIDVDDIECVINVDPPQTREDYIHRIGRTARNGKTGSARNYLTKQDHRGRRAVGTSTAKKVPSVVAPVSVAVVPLAVPTAAVEAKSVVKSRAVPAPVRKAPASVSAVPVSVKAAPPSAATPKPVIVPKIVDVPAVTTVRKGDVPAAEFVFEPVKKPITIRRRANRSPVADNRPSTNPPTRPDPQRGWQSRDLRRRQEFPDKPERTHTVFHAPPSKLPLVKRPGKRGPLVPFGDRKRQAEKLLSDSARIY